MPSSGLDGLKKHWRNDLIAGFSVSLVALPLALGLALASGAPPMSGLISAIIAGLVTTFFRGSHVAINGPGNGLVVVVAAGIVTLGDTPAEGFAHVLGASAVAGVLLVLLGALRLGKLGHAIPTGVIHGMLAAIGVIILGKQMHRALGHDLPAGGTIDALWAIPQSFMTLNPFVAIIGLGSLAVLFMHPKFEHKFVHFIPAPLWVLILSVPAAYFFGFGTAQRLDFFGLAYEVSPSLLIQLPDDLVSSMVVPSFAKLASADFWGVAISIALVAAVEDIVSVKAVENLDAYRRRSDLNKDLVGMGASTTLSAFLGGLPIITVIARSSVNMTHGAHTRWSNFFMGAFLLAFVLLLPAVMQLIPLAALAGILVYTGYKLTSPSKLAEINRRGPEQMLIFGATFYGVLAYGILWGLAAGVTFTAALHLSRAGMPFALGLRALARPNIDILHQPGQAYYLRVKGIANFLTLLPLRTRLLQLPAGEHVIVDFHNARLVDFTLLEFVHRHGRQYRHSGGSLDVVGLDTHQVASEHPFAMHTLVRPSRERRLTQRQSDLSEVASRHGWMFDSAIDWDVDAFGQFQFFETRPIEYRNNQMEGCLVGNVAVSISDITFDEGALVAEVYHTTVCLIRLPFEIPVFTLEQEEFFDRLMDLAGYKDIDFKLYPDFSSRFLLKGPDKQAIASFFTDERVSFFERGDIYHIESLGRSLLIFQHTRLASATEIERMTAFCEELVGTLRSDEVGSTQGPG